MAPVCTTALGEPAQTGIFQDLSFDDYLRRLPGVNSHTLGRFADTPLHVHYELLHGGTEPTRSLDLGWLTHLAVLEPERFEAETVVPPKVDRRRTEDKKLWAEFEAANRGKLFVDLQVRQAAVAMRDALLAHPAAGEFLRGPGVNELSLVWEEREAGVLAKARIDRVGTVGEWPIVGDFKTARDASRHAFERAIHTFRYHVQAAHYLAGLEALVPIPAGNPFRRFVFFVVENEAPWAVAVYELDDAALAVAEAERQRYLRTWRECNETGVWPGYSDSIELCSLPAWAFKTATAAGVKW